MKYQRVMVGLATLLSISCSSPEAEPQQKTAPAQPLAPVATAIDAQKLALFQPLPEVIAAEGTVLDQARIDLGRILYYDTRLSKNHDISCNSCHKLDSYGVDGQPTSSGHKGQKGGRNSPTVYNAAGHLAQFWDGRAKDVEEQAKGPVTNPIEMAMPDEKGVAAILESIPGYGDLFKAAFPQDANPISLTNAATAIAAFERKLVTPSRWDKFLNGDQTALTEDEKKGFLTFMDTGCQTCHLGTYVGGNMFQKAGLVTPWPSQEDAGRFDLTKQETDRMFFKVPSLRNIDKTGPYFHNGQVASLDEAVTLMARHQLGKELKPEDVSSIVTFLKALTGDIPTAYIQMPTLPESGPKTPKPDPT